MHSLIYLVDNFHSWGYKDQGHSFSVLEIYSPVKENLQIKGGASRIQKRETFIIEGGSEKVLTWHNFWLWHDSPYLLFLFLPILFFCLCLMGLSGIGHVLLGWGEGLLTRFRKGCLSSACLGSYRWILWFVLSKLRAENEMRAAEEVEDMSAL